MRGLFDRQFSALTPYNKVRFRTPRHAGSDQPRSPDNRRRDARRWRSRLLRRPISPDIDGLDRAVRGRVSGGASLPSACYGAGTGPKSGGGIRCFVAASYAEAIRNRVGSENGFPKNMIPTGSFAGTGPARRVPSRAVASRTRSYTCVVKPAGTDNVGRPYCPSRPQTELVRPANGGSGGAPRI